MSTDGVRKKKYVLSTPISGGIWGNNSEKLCHWFVTAICQVLSLPFNITKMPSRIYNHVWPWIVIPTPRGIPGRYSDINDGIDLSKVLHVSELENACTYIEASVYIPHTLCMAVFQDSLMHQIHFMYGHLLWGITAFACKAIPRTHWTHHL